MKSKKYNFKETVDKFEEYHKDPDQFYKIFIEPGFSWVDDGCDGFCSECEQKLKCEVYEDEVYHEKAKG